MISPANITLISSVDDQIHNLVLLAYSIWTTQISLWYYCAYEQRQLTNEQDNSDGDLHVHVDVMFFSINVSLF